MRLYQLGNHGRQTNQRVKLGEIYGGIYARYYWGRGAGTEKERTDFVHAGREGRRNQEQMSACQ